MTGGMSGSNYYGDTFRRHSNVNINSKIQWPPSVTYTFEFDHSPLTLPQVSHSIHNTVYYLPLDW